MKQIPSSNHAVSLNGSLIVSRNSATGLLAIPMTNDYLFRALLQRNNKVLKGLICALLHLDPSDVSSVVIANPIELGNAIDDKTLSERPSRHPDRFSKLYPVS